MEQLSALSVAELPAVLLVPLQEQLLVRMQVRRQLTHGAEATRQVPTMMERGVTITKKIFQTQ
ncbi:hypothetical protein FA375_25015 [Pseudomonas aeruginosa]|nr:hypothetical protein CEK59_07660 [Pseudomonas aeruginosa]KSD35163.1 hypothetical protein AO901_23960 [Pseudomonas aeruginosa]KSE14089.1 hypothetical protein AO922_24130 [Pseudomonas aeruginosa]KSE77927.1 hypothetical protein AO924_25420 [Pseudomonas aeruginosa]KSJ39367.1 hypothetical protein APA00_15615 [Pseudomonas aeruginosa]